MDLMADKKTSTRQRGSLLILCVTVLVIIALIGIAFLQRVRLDQAATARHERNYMPLVINGILTEIGNQLKDDVFENATNGRELYDYPWTKDIKHVNAFKIDDTRITVNGAGTSTGPGTFKPSHEDDRWLASTSPIWNDTQREYRWLHLTNLTGIWLDLESPNPQFPIDGPINNLTNSDTDIPLGYLEDVAGRIEPRGVDADLDGIMDSRWQWVPVPVREFGGRRYVMAVRIVDLNSMLNVNTATPATVDGNNTLRMRGYAPTGADLSRFFKRVDYGDVSLINNSGFPGDWANETRALLNKRAMMVNASAPLLRSNYGIPLSASENMTLWKDQAAIYGNLDRNYLIDSEMDLRRLGGVNDFSIQSPLENAMPKLLRQGPQFERRRGIEASYRDVVDPGNNIPSGNARISRWFYGSNPSNISDPDTNSVPVKNREFTAIRQWLTTASGVGAYVTKYGGAASAGGRLKFDLKQQWDNTTELQKRIQQAFRLPNPTTPNGGWYLGISDPRTQTDLIDEYVLAIQDYSDPDNIPTANGNFYGMERLPFLREVYVQALYADTDVVDAGGLRPGDPSYAGPDGQFDTWAYNKSPPPTGVGGDTRAMVIELGNPFAHRINGVDSLDPVTNRVEKNGLAGRVEVRVFQGNTTQIGQWLFDSTTPDIDARDDGAGNGDTLLIYSPPVDKLNKNLVAGPNDGNDLPGDLIFPADAKVLRLPDGTLTNMGTGLTPGGLPITVELWVKTSDGSMQRYDRIQLNPAASLPTSVDHSSAPTATPDPQFAQASSARDCGKIHFVVDDGPGSTDIIQNPPTASGTYSSGIDRFGIDNKGIAITPYPGDPTFFDRLQLPLADQPMRSTAELAWVHMFGFTAGQTFSERMSASGPAGLPANEHFLLIDPADPDFRVLPSPPTGAGISHAAVLMDVFTTVSPRNDGRDNDNDDGDDDPTTTLSDPPGPDLPSIDNKTEQFIPGTINVNTAPLQVLTLGSPLAESIDDTEKLMRMIVAYRDQPILAAANYPDVPPAITPFQDTTGTPNIRQITNRPFTAQAAINRQLGRGFKPGIGSIGELMFLNPYGPGAAPKFNVYNMFRYGRDGNTGLPNKVDLYPDPDETGSVAVNLGDDNEQRVARFQMLGQTFTVRSDRFVVYAVVRGYDGVVPTSPRFDSGKLAETAQFIAVFDRGSMENSTNGEPRVIGFVRLQ